MKWKVSNTLFLLAGLIFGLGVLFNWFQVKNSVESSLEKARRVKKEKAEKEVALQKKRIAMFKAASKKAGIAGKKKSTARKTSYEKRKGK